MNRPPIVPCGTCPYRKDVPSGIWSAEEYRKLPEYDKETGQQPFGVFLCHQQDGRVCAGWAAVHNMDHCLALRIAVPFGHMTTEVADAVREYETRVPLFETGTAAAAHGLRGIKRPSLKARRMIEALVKRKKSPIVGLKDDSEK